MKMRHVLLLVVLAVVLAACSTLPAPKNEQSTLFVIPVKFEKTATVEIYGRCELHIESRSGQGDVDTWVDATPAVAYKPTDLLPPGQYKVTEMRFVYYEGNREGNAHPIEGVYFETQPGRITILPMMVEYSIQKHSGRYKYMFYWKLNRMDKAKAKEILGKMMEEKNFAAWELSDKTASNPIIKAALREL
jgi:hypothetical protein